MPFYLTLDVFLMSRTWRKPTSLSGLWKPLIHRIMEASLLFIVLARKLALIMRGWMSDSQLVVKLCQILIGALLHGPILIGKGFDDADDDVRVEICKSSGTIVHQCYGF